MSRAEEIKNFAKLFSNRLESSLIDQALDYLRYNEEPLAFEILCEQLFEHDVKMSMAECATAEALAAQMQIECKAVKRLHELVNDVGGAERPSDR